MISATDFAFHINHVTSSTSKNWNSYPFLSMTFWEGYNEQGIYQDDPSISRHTLFFREDDPISIARKKWLDFIIDDYIFFWDVFSNKIKFGEFARSRFYKTP